MSSHSFTSNQTVSGRPVSNALALGADAQPLLSRTPVTLRHADFDQFIAGNGLPVVVIFWARWCSVSKVMTSYFGAGARRFGGQALFAKVEAADESRLAERYQIRSVPTIVLFCNGQEADRHDGAMSADQLELWLRPHLEMMKAQRPLP
ncbi:thioredoxin family protein [Caballeronia sp. 15715]|uniref:thioredoxin family protein n=1 Tax=Caballeronia sp. 15715 TaxID=3391030 RepID=UPI0039E26333